MAKLFDLIDDSSPNEIYAEIAKILLMIDPDFDPAPIKKVYTDIISLFEGSYPGYRASNTRYHNLEHTCSVVLATARLIHGLHVQNHSFSIRIMRLGLIGALFHDTGLIQKKHEHKGTGAQYTIGHEERSIELMRVYLKSNDYSAEDIKDCSHIIMSTILTLPLAEIPFRSNKVKAMGMILGSADLIAQMSDRTYLEKLPLLFQEFEEAKMPGFETPLELFKNTEEFYHSVARTRLRQELGNVAAAALYHFRERWNINSDLYAVSITNNIEYLKKVYEYCAESAERIDCILKRFRRT
jgi:HD superfamily phosphodiesterase